ncbi:MAG TPA: type II secretion system F family protein [Ktedonobacterales bacterium]|jgi:tight adherence protein B|nr:type II secretion system F family protein [Ktedonobacterales bacterium]
MVEAGVYAAVFADLGILGSAAPLLLGALVFVAVLLVVTGLRRTMTGGATGIASRLETFGALAPNAPATATRKGRQLGIYGRIDKAAARRGWGVKIADDLARADVKITVGEFVVARIVFASVGALLGLALPIGGRFLLAALLAALGYWLPRFYVDRQKSLRLRSFNIQLADTIGLLSSALRSGYSLLQAMELVSREGAAPVSNEFERVVREVGLGLSPEEALGNLVRRMESDDLELLVTVINVQREVGGNLAEVLDSIQSTIRERVKLMGDIRVLTAQQQYSGYIVGLLPVVLALILFIINPTYMLAVFQKTVWCGWTMFGCSAVMILAGFFLIQRIVDIKV